MQLLKLYRLPKGAKLTEVIEHPHSVEYVVSYAHSRICPDCAGTDCVIKGHKLTSAYHLPLSDTGTFITFSRTRYLCKECQSTFYDRPDWVHPTLNITLPLYDKVVPRLADRRTQAYVAMDLCIPPKLVSKIQAESREW